MSPAASLIEKAEAGPFRDREWHVAGFEIIESLALGKFYWREGGMPELKSLPKDDTQGKVQPMRFLKGSISTPGARDTAR